MPKHAAMPAEETGESAGILAARRVLRMEMEGLRALLDGLDERFEAAVALIAGIRGRVIVTGMGKSGHVARKIAATLASTGTPAQFVHPGEASHGDLGMIAAGDAVIALSNSGETAELADIVAYSRRFRIPLVAMTRRAASALAEAADVALLLPDSAEACPMGLAPTTSTTMMLALGDAIAVALLERKGFSVTDFHVLHPGGQLGRKLLRVSDIMHRGEAMPLVAGGTGMAEAILVMSAKSFGCVGVVDEAGRLVGIITDGDLRRHMSSELLAARVEAVMSTSPRTIRPRALVGEALSLMNAGTPRILCLFVVEDSGRPIGILNVHDCLRAGAA
ncbi:MAG TPA: KpsF/GutQ family sugar-phosphate isomerase [Stellaceae bacterium]|nr:KpsF/GutQ family sugar-phosphate isomerase [Stellaceae bacterium]